MSDEATDLGNVGFGLMFYNARWYDPSLGRFAQADSIVPDGVQGYDRYAYVNNSPANFTDPTGHCAVGDDAESCGPNGGTNHGSVSSSGLQYIIKNRYKWNLINKDLTYDELLLIYQTGNEIESYVNGLTGGKGLAWMNKYMGNIFIGIWRNDAFNDYLPSDRGTGIPGFVFLPKDWTTRLAPKHYLVHELGHIWDSTTGSLFSWHEDHYDILGISGGVADSLNSFINGTVVADGGCRFCDNTGANYIPKDYRYTQKSSLYGNNSTADYLADSFANAIYQPGNIPQLSVALWIDAAISVQSNHLP